jgi:hypothetical protein
MGLFLYCFTVVETLIRVCVLRAYAPQDAVRGVAEVSPADGWPPALRPGEPAVRVEHAVGGLAVPPAGGERVPERAVLPDVPGEPDARAAEQGAVRLVPDAGPEELDELPVRLDVLQVAPDAPLVRSDVLQVPPDAPLVRSDGLPGEPWESPDAP